MGTALSDACGNLRSPFTSLKSIEPKSSSLLRTSIKKLTVLTQPNPQPDELSPTAKSEHSHLDTTVTIGDETLAEIHDDQYLLPEEEDQNCNAEKQADSKRSSSPCLHHSLSCPLPAKRKLVCLRDFTLSRLIGHGNCGKSFLISKKQAKRRDLSKNLKSELAMKIVNRGDKKYHSLFVIYHADQPQIIRMDCDFIVQLKQAFLNKNKIFLIMEHYINSDFSQILATYQRLPEDSIKFYAAQVVLALEYLHIQRGVRFANLHIEKVLLDKDGNIKLTDICNCTGGAAFRRQLTRKSLSYSAPELINTGTASRFSDFWSLGVFIYHLYNGHLPFLKDFTNNNYTHDDSSFFEDHDENEIRIEYPEDMTRSCLDIVGRLLEQTPERRLGANGFQEIKRHSFFREIDWEKMLIFQVKPPLKPHRKQSDSEVYELSDGEGHVLPSAQNNLEEYEIV